MDQARSTISKIFNGEPRSYTRFNLTQNMEGDNSQVEMKLSADVDEEEGGTNGVGEHLKHNSARNPYVVRKAGRTPRNICFIAAATLLIFIIGYLIAYLVHHKKDVAPTCASSTLPFDDTQTQSIHETGAAPLMDWSNVKALFAEKLSADRFEDAFREFSSESHRAGSSADESLRIKVMNLFKQYDMEFWTDKHYVKVQELPAGVTNKVSFKGREEKLTGFLSYSANGTVTGSVLYAYYGQAKDLRLLQDRNIDLSGRVLLVRAGKISLAEKVANAAKLNVSAVLIYPDSADYSMAHSTELFGHVHLGSGDPYTPGFPSFNHTQFPPVKSSGLPSIPAQTITAAVAYKILSQLGGQTVPADWGSIGNLGDLDDVITVEVNNILTEKKITNIFGVIKGLVDPDRYVVLGAQRDAWGPGFARSTVGTSVLLELARSISAMVKNDGFKPRRSIVFASWTAGEYGSVGATEWLEGYLTSLSSKAFSYINLDGVVAGPVGFKAAASPLLHTLIVKTLKEVKVPKKSDVSLYDEVSKGDWKTNVLEPLKQDDAAYPFLAFSGIPSLSFRLTNSEYQYYGTLLDNQSNLRSASYNGVSQLAVTAAQFAGHMALRLVHDYLLPLNTANYDDLLTTRVAKIKRNIDSLKRIHPELLPKTLTMQWLSSAVGSYHRASAKLNTDIKDSDLEDIEECRNINDRIMMVERNLLSPYVSPKDSPFRHILVGSGPHTIQALLDHLDALRISHPNADADLFRNQFALATWTIQGCANALVGSIWRLHNDV